MTADIELLPLPEGVDVIFSPDGNGAALDVFTAEQVQDYARANVAHATEPLKAEIEALRAEVERLRNRDAEWNRTAGEAVARAERLAEALRDAAEALQVAGLPGNAKLFRSMLRDHDQEGK